MKKILSASSLLLMFFAYMIYSSTGIFSKLASMQVFLTGTYLLFFTMIIVTLAVYAVLWQIILKRVPLGQAFLFKSSGIVFALVYAHFLFGEQVSIWNIAGALLIMTGIAINSYRPVS